VPRLVDSRTRQSCPGQALVEVALVIPMLLVLAFGVVGLGRLTQTQMALSAVAREAARTGALADRASDARAHGEQRGIEVGTGYNLASPPLVVRVDTSNFGRCGSVSARATYNLDLSDLPFLGWVRYTLQSTHAEPIDRFRSQLDGPC
jgi:hypothetical protein